MNTIHLSQICPLIFKNNSRNSDVWNQEIDFEKGKTYLIEASSGSGKSSLFSFLCGYRNDYSGHLFFDQQNISDLSIADWTNIRSHHLSHLIQDLRLFPELTAFENISIKNQLTQYCSEQQIMEWMDLLEIADKRDIAAKKLSFGQQQRVALLRSLVQPFDFFLADEPISHLDDTNAQRIGTLIAEEVKKRNAGLIVSSIGRHLSISYDTIFHL